MKQLEVPIRNSSETTINSYDSHVFVIKFVNPKLTFEVDFAKLADPEVVTVTFSPGSGLVVEQRTKYDDMVANVDLALQTCADETGKVKSSCVAEQILGDHLKLEASKEHLKKISNKIAHKLRNYTCADPDLKTSDIINTHSLYVGDGNGRPTKYIVNDMFEHTHSKIWTIENFATDEECAVLMRHGKPRLTRATVAAADGSNIVSEARKANQAVYDVKHKKDPLYALSNRILQIANRKNNMQLEHDGQESFTIIQYDENDEYA